VITTLTNTRNSTKNQTTLEKYKWEEFLREFQRNSYLQIQDVLSKTLCLVALVLLEDVKTIE
jgi:4-hydroxy-3-methylbut-2-enyl diphosphate reductase IspH